MKTELIGTTLARSIEDRLLERHRERLRSNRLADARLRVEGWREPTRVIVRLTLSRPDKSLHYPMEAGVALPPEVGDGRSESDAAAIERAMWLAVDFLGYYVERYLESGRETLLPLDWGAVSFGDHEIFARGWERNLALEEAGDRWLAGEPVDLPESVADRRRRRLAAKHPPGQGPAQD